MREEKLIPTTHPLPLNKESWGEKDDEREVPRQQAQLRRRPVRHQYPYVEESQAAHPRAAGSGRTGDAPARGQSCGLARGELFGEAEEERGQEEGPRRPHREKTKRDVSHDEDTANMDALGNEEVAKAVRYSTKNPRRQY